MADLDRLDWHDVKFFLATLRAGSLRRAAEALGVSRPTVGRRLAALERQLGFDLFERRTEGALPTPEARALLGPAEEVERAMRGLERAAQGVDGEMRGPVRVTLPALVAAELLMDDFAAFCRQWPGIDLQIGASVQLESLSNREADVAVRFRPTGVSPAAHLTGRRVGTVYISAYGGGDHWIGQPGLPDTAAKARDAIAPGMPVRGAQFDGVVLRAACRAGLGRAILPCFVAEPLLEPLHPPWPGWDCWVLVHPDLRHNPRLRAFRDVVVDALRRQLDRLEARAG